MNEFVSVTDRGSDLDPHLICVAGSGSRRAKMTHKNRKIKKFVLKCWMFYFEDEGFSCSLGVLFECQGRSKLQFYIKFYNKISAVIFFANF